MPSSNPREENNREPTRAELIDQLGFAEWQVSEFWGLIANSPPTALNDELREKLTAVCRVGWKRNGDREFYAVSAEAMKRQNELLMRIEGALQRASYLVHMKRETKRGLRRRLRKSTRAASLLSFALSGLRSPSLAFTEECLKEAEKLLKAGEPTNA